MGWYLYGLYEHRFAVLKSSTILLVHKALQINVTNFHIDNSKADYGKLERVFGEFNHSWAAPHLYKQVRHIRIITSIIFITSKIFNISTKYCILWKYWIYPIFTIFTYRSSVGKIVWFLTFCISLVTYLQKSLSCVLDVPCHILQLTFMFFVQFSN